MKINLDNIAGGFNLQKINSNFARIAEVVNSKLLFRDNPSGEPNALISDVDANSRSIYNAKNVATSKLNVGGVDVTDAIVNIATGVEMARIKTDFTTKLFSGDGVTTEFVLDTDASVVDNIKIDIEGVGQRPGKDFNYTPLTKTVKFLTAPPPPLGTDNICVSYGNAFSFPLPQASTVYGGVTVGGFTLNQTTPLDRIVFDNTQPLNWNTGPGKMSVDFEFISNGYFAANPTGHVSFVTRCDTVAIVSDVRGAGAIFGDLTWTGFEGDQALYTPTTILESWSRPQITGQRFIWPDSTGPRNALLQDGTKYRMIIDSTVQPNTPGVYIRYRLYRAATPSTKLAWDLMVDTGDVLDSSNISDMTKSGFVVGQVFASNLSTWSIDFTNCRITWGPCGNVVTDNSASLNKRGADLKGDITLLGSGRTMKFPTTTGPSLADAFSFQSSTPNSSTPVVVKPSGSGTNASVLLTNNSSSTTTYQAAVFSVDATQAAITTLSLAAADLPFNIFIGPAYKVASFTINGLNVKNATKSIGQPISWAITGAGGANATAFTSSAFGMESPSTDGVLRTYMGPTPTNAEVEIVVRPLYCILSSLIAELKSKNVI